MERAGTLRFSDSSTDSDEAIRKELSLSSTSQCCFIARHEDALFLGPPGTGRRVKELSPGRPPLAGFGMTTEGYLPAVAKTSSPL